jgi:starch-binding outer membrane protein SusE/F
MKRTNILFIVLLCIIGFTSCEEGIGVQINSAAESGTLKFHLNQPQYSNYVLEDANALLDMDALTCVQPNYGFTAAVSYTTQVGFDSTFIKDTYQSLPTTVNGEKVGVNIKEMDKAIIALYGGKLPDPVVEKEVFIRLKAVVSTSTTNPTDTVPTVKPLYSNAIKLRIKPYVLPLFPYTEVAPNLWYIIGLGDGGWHNDKAHLGSSIIPLSLVAGKKYNLNGDGEFTYTGYFSHSREFKLIGPNLKWDGTQWGMTGTNYVQNGANNITVPSDGYYTITLNSVENTLTIVPATAPTESYASIGIVGGINNWGNDVPPVSDVIMKPVETTNNHVWYIDYTFAADSQCKFRVNNKWDTNWGTPSANDGDPLYSSYGIASKGGKNILGKAGSYIIVFNDIDRSYSFFKK